MFACALINNLSAAFLLLHLRGSTFFCRHYSIPTLEILEGVLILQNMAYNPYGTASPYGRPPGFGAFPGQNGAPPGMGPPPGMGMLSFSMLYQS
jgi:hypothetical protein